MISQPLAGKRETVVTETRIALDFAHVLRYISDVLYPHAEKIVLVTDNLNTHSPASFYIRECGDLPFHSPTRWEVLRGQRQRDESLWIPILRCGREWIRQLSLLRLALPARTTAGRVGEYGKSLHSRVYKSFPPEEACRLTERFEWHFIPKHGSWLNMAEIEIDMMSRQALAKLFPDRESFKKQVRAWTIRRNANAAKIN